MAGSKKSRKKSISSAELARRKSASQAAFYRVNPDEQYKDQEREHYTREIARLNSPHTRTAIEAVIGPMERAVLDIERTGDGVVDREGDYVFFPHGGKECYPLPDGLFSLCATAALVEDDERRRGLVRLAHKLQAHMPLFAADIEGARAGFAWAREQMAKVPPTEFTRLAAQAETTRAS